MESLHDRIPAGFSPNDSTFRHIMLLDPTESETSVTLFNDLIKVHNDKIKEKDPNSSLLIKEVPSSFKFL
jgi:hypothetical protein